MKKEPGDWMIKTARGFPAHFAAALAAVIGGFAIPTSATASSITLGFPSSTSRMACDSVTNALGPGGGGVCSGAGDSLTQTFNATGLASTNSSQWVFGMSDYTDAGVLNSFAVDINGTQVGSFSFAGTGTHGTHSFDLTFTSPSIAGPDYTLSVVATSTVPSGDGSWDWLPGGSVTLTDPVLVLADPVPVPAPAPLSLLASGLAGLWLIARRRDSSSEMRWPP